MELSNAVLKNTANISHLYDTIQEIVIHKSASTIIPALCLTFSRTRIFTPTIRANLHRHEPCLHTLWYLLFSLPPNLFHHSWSLRQGYRHVSDIYLRHLHRNYRHITAKKKFTPTFTPTKLHQPSAFTDQQLIWLLSQNYPKRERTRRFKEKRVLHLIIYRNQCGK